MGLVWLFPGMALGGRELSVWSRHSGVGLGQTALPLGCVFPKHPASSLTPKQESNHRVKQKECGNQGQAWILI